MPRTRRYQPIPDRLCDSEHFESVSEAAQGLLFRLFTQCDDIGRFFGSTAMLRGRLYPIREEITLTTIGDRLRELVDRGLLYRWRACDGEYYVQVVDYLSSAKNKAPRVRFPDPCRCGPEAEHPAWDRGNGSVLFVSAHSVSMADVIRLPALGDESELNGPNGTNGKRKIPLTALPDTVTDTLHPAPCTTDTVPEPDTLRTGDGGACSHSPPRVGAESESVVVQPGESGNGSVGKAGTDWEGEWNRVVLLLAKGKASAAIDSWATLVLAILKPDFRNQTVQDRADVTSLGFTLSGKTSGRAELLREPFYWCLTQAESVRVTGAKSLYGAWRTRAAKKFGNWSVKGAAK